MENSSLLTTLIVGISTAATQATDQPLPRRLRWPGRDAGRRCSQFRSRDVKTLATPVELEHGQALHQVSADLLNTRRLIRLTKWSPALLPSPPDWTGSASPSMNSSPKIRAAPQMLLLPPAARGR